MTVKYLQTMQRNQINASATGSVPNDPTVLYKFKAGFSDCTNEVSRYISQIDGVDANVKQRLMGHLNNCVTGIQQAATPFSTLSSSSSSSSKRLHSFRKGIYAKFLLVFFFIWILFSHIFAVLDVESETKRRMMNFYVFVLLLF